MSPRRKFEPGEEPLFWALPLAPGRRGGCRLPVWLPQVLMAAAITVSTLMLISHESRSAAASKNPRCSTT